MQKFILLALLSVGIIKAPKSFKHFFNTKYVIVIDDKILMIIIRAHLEAFKYIPHREK